MNESRLNSHCQIFWLILKTGAFTDRHFCLCIVCVSTRASVCMTIYEAPLLEPITTNPLRWISLPKWRAWDRHWHCHSPSRLGIDGGSSPQ